MLNEREPRTVALRSVLLGLAAVFVVAASAVGGYLVGRGAAPNEEEAQSVRLEARSEAAEAAVGPAHAKGDQKGRVAGVRKGMRQGNKDGAAAGAEEGSEQAEGELAQIAAQRAAAEAAAAAAVAAQTSIPPPCAHLPPSTARNMCIGAVEAGRYP